MATISSSSSYTHHKIVGELNNIVYNSGTIGLISLDNDTIIRHVSCLEEYKQDDPLRSVTRKLFLATAHTTITSNLETTTSKLKEVFANIKHLVNESIIAPMLIYFNKPENRERIMDEIRQELTSDSEASVTNLIRHTIEQAEQNSQPNACPPCTSVSLKELKTTTVNSINTFIGQQVEILRYIDKAMARKIINKWGGHSQNSSSLTPIKNFLIFMIDSAPAISQSINPKANMQKSYDSISASLNLMICRLNHSTSSSNALQSLETVAHKLSLEGVNPKEIIKSVATDLIKMIPPTTDISSNSTKRKRE